MSKKSVQPVSRAKKKEEYQAFLDVVGSGKLPANWSDLAEALGVRAATISDWKKRPEFQKALMRGINKSFSEMSKVGKKDWRMWRERYSMLTKEDNRGTTVNVTVPVFNVMTGEAKNQLEKLYEGSDSTND